MKAACEGEGATFRLGRHSVNSVSAEGGQPHAIRNGLICAFVVAACLWAAYPVAEIGINDDWSYAHVAQVFAKTGHFAYNGWESAMLGWQVLWAALFIKLFGFSFTVVRLSMLPIAMATVFLFHAILLRFGVNPRNAVLGALTLGLSPLFLPLAASYMTDVPGLFVILLCLYFCQRAVAANSSNATIAWLCLAAASSVVGGTARQTGWLGALAMVPSVGWMLRKRRSVLWVTLLLWLTSIVSVVACMRWFARQPYSVPEPVLEGRLALNQAVLVFHLFFQLLGTVLCLALLVFPILVTWLPEARRLSRAALLRVALITFGWSLFQRVTSRAGWTMPWLPNLIRAEFAAARADLTLLRSPPQAIFLPRWVQEAVSLLVVATALVLIENLWTKLASSLSRKAGPAASWQDMWWLIGPFSLSYLVVLMPRAYHSAIFDRYLLPLMPIAILCLLRLSQEWTASTLPAGSVIVLAIFALLAIAGTHDWFAYYRARLTAIDEIRASGVPRTEIQGGYEYDGWTQLEISGHMEGAKYISQLFQLKIPGGAIHPGNPSQPVANECRLYFAPYMPIVHPKFTIAFGKMWCLVPSKYPPVMYRTWLPPYHGTILVQQIPDGADR